MNDHGRPLPAGDRFAPRLLTHFATNSAMAEAYRVVRTGLLARSTTDAGGTVLVTSAGRGEGKSLTVANLGIILSRTEQRIAIIDADLRLPTMHKLFDVPAGDYAAQLEHEDATALAADPDWVERFAVPVLKNLWVIPAGVPVQHPSELLQGRAFTSFLDSLRARFDVVLVDSPPVSLVTDASVLTSRVDSTVFVLDFKRTRRADAKRAVERLQASNGNLVGTVVNRQPATRAGTYGTAYGG